VVLSITVLLRCRFRARRVGPQRSDILRSSGRSDQIRHRSGSSTKIQRHEIDKYTFCRQLGTALAIASAGILLTGLNVMAQTKLTIGPSPHPSVTVSPVGEDKSFNRVFNADTEQFRDLHVIIHNNDSRPVVAAVLIWEYADVKGQGRKTILQTDTWQRPHTGPNDKAEIVPAKSRTLDLR
jgi:hypothetical protein